MALPQWQWPSYPSPHRYSPSGEQFHGEVSQSALNSICFFASHGISSHRSKGNGASVEKQGRHTSILMGREQAIAAMDCKDTVSHRLVHDNGTRAKLSGNPAASSPNLSTDFTGGDDSGNGLGSGGPGGNDSSGHGHNFWSGDPFRHFDDGMSLLGMYAVFLGIGKATSLDDVATFDCSNLFGDGALTVLQSSDRLDTSGELTDLLVSEEGLLDGTSWIEHDVCNRCRQWHLVEEKIDSMFSSEHDCGFPVQIDGREGPFEAKVFYTERSDISASMEGHGFQSFAHKQLSARKQLDSVIGWFVGAKEVSSSDEAQKGENQASSHDSAEQAYKVEIQVTGHNSPDKAKMGEKEQYLEVAKVQSEHASMPAKLVAEPGGTPPAAKQSDVDTLKRLQREIFSELMKLRERLEKMEKGAQASHQSGAARTHLKGEVKAGAAFVLVEESSSRHSRDSLEQAGLQTGLDVRFMFETPFRERDLLITECWAGQGSSVGDGRALGGPLSLAKVQYVTHLNEDVSLSFVPLGAQGKDVTEIINVVQDQGLTRFSSQGPSLFTHCRGSAIGATVSGSRFAFSVGQYLSGWGDNVSAMSVPSEGDPLCLSSLGQVLLQPMEGLVLSLSGLRRYWPSPPLPSSTALHWSEMGPLVIPKLQSLKTSMSNTANPNLSNKPLMHTNRSSSYWEAPTDLEYGTNIYGGNGTSLHSVAISSSFDLGEFTSIGGWAQLEKEDWFQASHGKDNLQWALSVARASGSGVDWGLCVGGSQRDMWSMPSVRHGEYSEYDGADSYGLQLHVEAFLKLHCGRGFTLQPGILHVSNSRMHTPTFVLRSTWSL